jgi:hypothetical protein
MIRVRFGNVSNDSARQFFFLAMFPLRHFSGVNDWCQLDDLKSVVGDFKSWKIVGIMPDRVQMIYTRWGATQKHFVFNFQDDPARSEGVEFFFARLSSRCRS